MKTGFLYSRSNSKRLKNKSFKKIGNLMMVEHVIARLKKLQMMRIYFYLLQQIKQIIHTLIYQKNNIKILEVLKTMFY